MGLEVQGPGLWIPEVERAGIDGRDPTRRVQQPVRGLLEIVGGAKGNQEVARDPDGVRVSRCLALGGDLVVHLAKVERARTVLHKMASV